MGDRLDDIVSEGKEAISTQEPLQTDIRRLGKGAGIALVGRIGGRGLLLMSQVMLARLLGPAEFGLFALGWTLLQMGGVIAPFGLHQGIVHYGTRFWRKDDERFRALLGQVLWVAAGIGILVAAGIFVSASWLAAVFQKPDLEWVFRGFALALLLVPVLKVGAAATRISQRMQFSVLAEDVMPAAVLLVGAGVLTGLAGWGVRGAVLAAGVGFAAATGLVLFFVKHLYGWKLRMPVMASVPLKELFVFSLPASLAGTFTMLTLRVDRMLVGYFLPASEVGVYQAASQAAMLSAIILTAFNAIFAPMIARLYHERKMERLNELFKVSTKWGLYVSLPLFLVLAIAPQEVMTVVFGDPYAAGSAPMLIMAGAQLVNAGTGAVGFMLIMTGHPTRWLALSTTSFVTNLVLGVILIPRMGILGAALAVAGAVVFLFVGGLFQVRRLLKLWPYDCRYVKGGIAALITIIVLTAGKLSIQASLNSAILLCGIGFGSLVLFAGLLWVLRPDPEDREIIHLLLSRVSALSG